MKVVGFVLLMALLVGSFIVTAVQRTSGTSGTTGTTLTPATPIATQSPKTPYFLVQVSSRNSWNKGGIVMMQGSCLVVDADGSSSQRTVGGETPATYGYQAQSVSCSFQNQEQSGILQLSITKEGKLVKQVETTAAYGVVSAAVN